MDPHRQRVVFYCIVVAQFLGTSLWFAGNAILPSLQQNHQWPASALGYLTSSTQLGFIAGTLTFAMLGVVDRFSPSRIFFISSLIASACNLLTLLGGASLPMVLASRGLVGFFLAGIYPVGMKIAADWNDKGLGHWLGALVGALVLGTAFPYSLKLIPQFLDPAMLLVVISLLCAMGGIVIISAVPDGPYRKKSMTFTFAALQQIFSKATFRSPTLGYFGHMWELYAFWAFIPWIIGYYHQVHPLTINPSLLAFMFLGAGAAGCYAGGLLSFRLGSRKVAFTALVGSGCCCLLSPWLWDLPPIIFIGVMFAWGITAAADSPQLSALVARYAPDEFRGSAITLVICIGFAITIGSIQLLSFLQNIIHPDYLLFVLAPGPLLGAWALARPGDNE